MGVHSICHHAPGEGPGLQSYPDLSIHTTLIHSPLSSPSNPAVDLLCPTLILTRRRLVKNCADENTSSSVLKKRGGEITFLCSWTDNTQNYSPARRDKPWSQYTIHMDDAGDWVTKSCDIRIIGWSGSHTGLLRHMWRIPTYFHFRSLSLVGGKSERKIQSVFFLPGFFWQREFSS